MSAGIDIPVCHPARNRTTISGNHGLCLSPEGISEDLQLCRPFSASAIFIIVADIQPCALNCTACLPRNPDLGPERTVRCLPVPSCHSPRVATSACIRDSARSSEPMRAQARTEFVQVRPQPSGILARMGGATNVEPDC